MKQIASVLSILLCTLIVVQSPLAGGAGSPAVITSPIVNVAWTSLGVPYGGRTSTVAVDPADPNIVFAESGNKLYKSTDGGSSWVRTSLSAYVMSITFAHDMIYVGCGWPGLTISMDSGATWIDLAQTDNPNGGGGAMEAVAVHPTDPYTIYVGHGIYGGGVYKTTNLGNSWISVGNNATGLTNLNVVTLLIDPVDANIVYAGTDGGGVFRSIDAGASWIAINGNAAEPTYIEDTNIRCLAMEGDVLYVGTNSSIYTSSNARTSTGENTIWAKMTAGPQGAAIRNIILRTEIIYTGTEGNGVFKSTDSGANWSAVNTGLPSLMINNLAVHPTDINTAYVAGDNGVYKTGNGGESWSPYNNGLAISIFEMAVNPGNADIIYAGSGNDGLFVSTNRGLTWTRTVQTPCHIEELAFNPGNPATMYMITGCSIYKSTDSGLNWSESRLGFSNDFFPGGLAVNPINPDTLYVGTGGDGIYMSINAALTWTAASKSGFTNLNVRSIAVAPTQPEKIFAGTEGGGIFVSADNGASWTASNSGLESYRVCSLAIEPGNPANMCAMVDNQPYRSIDGGATWQRILDELIVSEWLYDNFTIDLHDPATIYVSGWNMSGSNDEALAFVSQDRGLTWQDISAGITYTGGVYEIAVDGADPNLLYAGTASGIYQGTVSMQVAAPVFSPAAGTYSAAQTVTISCATADAAIHYTLDGSDPTEASAVYSAALTIDATTTIKARAYKTDWVASDVAEATYTIGSLGVVAAGSLPAEFALYPAYPNPFNPSSTIRFDLPEAANVQLVVYSIIGREVVRLVDGHQEAGYRQVMWNGRDKAVRDVPSGIYIARLSIIPPTAGVTAEYSRSIKMLLLR